MGRGLRRISYDNLSEPEYVTVFGVPFTYLPVEEKPGPPRPPIVKTKIEPIQERKSLNVGLLGYLTAIEQQRARAELSPIELKAFEYAKRAADVEGTPIARSISDHEA